MSNILNGGDRVAVLDTIESSFEDSAETVRDFFHTMPGVLVKKIDFIFPDSSWSWQDIDLFVVPYGDYFFRIHEIIAIRDILEKGTNVLLAGDNKYWSLSDSNYEINSLLSSLDIPMSLAIDSNDSGYEQATILSDPYTAGMASFSFATTTQVIGGTPLIQSSQGRTILARMTIVPEPASGALAAIVSSAFALIGLRSRWLGR
jgi:hypothetical protein